jgi:hypothetical protein
MSAPDIAEIARGLTKAMRAAVTALDADWQAGPILPGEVLPGIKPCQAAGLAERQFMDETPAAFGQRGEELFVKPSACWFFRLTPLGLAVRDYLKENPQ